MGHLDPIAYTYEADTHCRDCYVERIARDFGISVGAASHEVAVFSERTNEWEDGEGNRAGIIAPWDAWWDGNDECERLVCGTCHETIDEAHGDHCDDEHRPCTLSLIVT